MERFARLLPLIAIAVLFLVSCEKDGGSGRVNYSFGAVEMRLTDPHEFSLISDAYIAEFQKIEGAMSFEYSGSSFEMEGRYKDTDARVVAACKAAESVCDSKGLPVSDGYLTLEVTATYYEGSPSKVIYSVTFGDGDSTHGPVHR